MNRDIERTWGKGRVMALEGFRGFLILYVMLYHVQDMAPTLWARSLFSYGLAAVDAFFVLSGFVLMGSYVRHGYGYDGGWTAYVRRRFKRLLPLYYAGLALSLLVVATIPFYVSQGQVVSNAWPSNMTIALHVAAVQNFFVDHVSAINSSYWFVAMELQLSLLFPLLAWSCRRWGFPVVFLVVLVVLAVWYAVVGEWSYFAKGQYVCLFLFGMWSAVSLDRTNGASSAPLGRWFGALAALGSCIVGARVADLTLAERFHAEAIILIDTLTGLAAACTLMLCASPRINPVRVVLESGVLVRIGALSYASYILHMPVLTVMRYWFTEYGTPVALQQALLGTVGIAVVLLLAIPIHRLFEAETVTRRPSRFTNP